MTTWLDVASADWHGVLAQQRAAGYGLLGFITAIDRGDQLEVVALVERPDPYDAILVRTQVPSASAALPSVSDLWSGAIWHEREAHELFEITFDGCPDVRPLLQTSAPGVLRRDRLLSARIRTPWPGSAEPGEGKGNPSRRRLLPPGVPAERSVQS